MPTAQSAPPRLIKFSDAAQFLGVSKRGLHNLVERGLITPVRLDAHLRFAVDDLEELIERSRQE